MERVELSGIRLPEVSMKELRLPSIGNIPSIDNSIYDAILAENGDALVMENGSSYMCLENNVN